MIQLKNCSLDQPNFIVYFWASPGTLWQIGIKTVTIVTITPRVLYLMCSTSLATISLLKILTGICVGNIKRTSLFHKKVVLGMIQLKNCSLDVKQQSFTHYA
jgi:hypothetical protein